MKDYSITFRTQTEPFKLRQLIRRFDSRAYLDRFIVSLQAEGAEDVVWMEKPVVNGATLRKLVDAEASLMADVENARTMLKDAEERRHKLALAASKDLFGVDKGSVVLSGQRLYVVDSGYSFLDDISELKNRQPFLMVFKILKNGKVSNKCQRIGVWTPVAYSYDALPDNLKRWG